MQTSEERAQGLMFRDSLQSGKGMLFVFEESGEYAFWMQNMKFSIDMLWIDEAKTLVHVKGNVPPCTGDPCPVYSPDTGARYVLEIPAGDSARYGLTAGRSVTVTDLKTRTTRR